MCKDQCKCINQRNKNKDLQNDPAYNNNNRHNNKHNNKQNIPSTEYTLETYTPSCESGVNAVLDGCGCCLVCPRQHGDQCDPIHPCDAAKKLICVSDNQHVSNYNGISGSGSGGDVGGVSAAKMLGVCRGLLLLLILCFYC
ncbi:hypothetical protein HELRODRAFT_67598 [Helobdella robusta]|uniref:IGFBP N-terminal domain-containing protein n=1 Tax=Helobdella robusta TaxID=6412 RepID=T1FZ28_HELRO|nr:hypothetical protein HELRODRAFT_67598 [Helobdella robusta]ESN96665.1 hypothetical protein HELRODRAFT_67598 [Helobdella robusta]